jgi:hypothetical protein
MPNYAKLDAPRLIERVTQGEGQLLWAGRGCHDFRRADEERARQHMTQSAKRVAHDGLAEADLLAGAGDVPFLDHPVEDDQEIEDPEQINAFCACTSDENAFPAFQGRAYIGPRRLEVTQEGRSSDAAAGFRALVDLINGDIR